MCVLDIWNQSQGAIEAEYYYSKKKKKKKKREKEKTSRPGCCSLTTSQLQQ